MHVIDTLIAEHIVHTRIHSHAHTLVECAMNVKLLNCFC